MRFSIASIFIISFLMLFLTFTSTVNGSPYIDTVDDDVNYAGNYIDEMLNVGDVGVGVATPQKRACIRRGGNCEHQQHDCCYNSSCRCNLWGANCRCQRMGLFQKWG